MRALKNLKAGIPPRARLMLSVTIGVVVVAGLGIVNLVGGSGPGPREDRGSIDVVMNPSEHVLPRTQPGDESELPEGNIAEQIAQAERERALREALEGQSSHTDRIALPRATEQEPVIASEPSEMDQSVNALQELIEQRREQERQRRVAAREEAGGVSNTGRPGGQIGPVMLDKDAFLQSELALARGQDDVVGAAMERLVTNTTAVRPQGSATGSRSSGSSGTTSQAQRTAVSPGASVEVSAADYVAGYARDRQPAAAPANTVSERLARYRQAMQAAEGDPEAQLDTRVVGEVLSGGGASGPVTATSGPVDSSSETAGRMIPAGRILYAVLDTAVNSDTTQYVRATIVQEGPFKGATAIGQVQLRGDRVVLSFNRLGHKGRDYAFQAVAVDPDTTQTALADHVDRHLLERYGLFWAAAFMEGFAEAMSDTTTVINSDGSQTSTRARLPDTRDQVLVATGKVGERTVPLLSSRFNRPPTVHVGGDGSRAIGLMLLQGLPY